MVGFDSVRGSVPPPGDGGCGDKCIYGWLGGGGASRLKKKVASFEKEAYRDGSIRAIRVALFFLHASLCRNLMCGLGQSLTCGPSSNKARGSHSSLPPPRNFQRELAACRTSRSPPRCGLRPRAVAYPPSLKSRSHRGIRTSLQCQVPSFPLPWNISSAP